MECPASPHPDDAPLPRPPRFSLRGLLLWLAALSVLFAIMSNIGVLWSAVLLWILLLIAGHVLGNLWGSQAYHPLSTDRAGPLLANSPTGWQPTDPDAIRLRKHVRGGRGRVFGIAIGALLLGAAGGTFFTMCYWNAATAPGIAVWYSSCSIVGALAGFVGSGFLQVCAGHATGPRALLAPCDSK